MRVLHSVELALCHLYDSLHHRARVNLKRGIESAKLEYKQQIEEDFDNNFSPQQMWEDIRSITDYKKETETSTPGLR